MAADKQAEMVESLANFSEPEAEDAPATTTAELSDGDAVPEVKTAAPEPEEKQRVPLAELLEERRRAREAEKQLREMQNVFMQAALKRQEAAAKEPEKPKLKYEDSPIDYLKQEVDDTKETAKRLATEKEMAEQRQAALNQQEMQMREFTKAVRTDEKKFVESAPDYYEALDYVRSMTAASLEEYDLTPEEMSQQIRNSEFQQALAALQRNKSPAQTIYRIAKKLGYKKVENPEGAGKTEQNKGQIEQQARKQKAALNPTSSGLPTVDDLAEMPSSDFDQAFASVFGKK
jgi:hypothetical protein